MPAAVSTLPVLGVPGSLRPASYTRALLDHALALVDGAAPVERVRPELLPYYDAEADGVTDHAEVLEGRRRITGCAGVIISTPEYNGSAPATVKNWLDWMTRPMRGHVLMGVPVLILGASPSPKGAATAIGSLSAILGFLGATIVHEPVGIADVAQHIDLATGAVDDETSQQVRSAVAALVAVLRPA